MTTQQREVDRRIGFRSSVHPRRVQNAAWGRLVSATASSGCGTWANEVEGIGLGLVVSIEVICVGDPVAERAPHQYGGRGNRG